MAHFDGLIWPPVRHVTAILSWAEARNGEASLEQEKRRGVIRSHPAGVSVRSGNGQRSGAEVRRSPAHGPGSAGRCGTQTTEDHRKSTAETGTGGSIHRRDPGERSESPAQAAAHGAPNLQPVAD